jgi:hypothetical protein
MVWKEKGLSHVFTDQRFKPEKGAFFIEGDPASELETLIDSVYSHIATRLRLSRLLDPPPSSGHARTDLFLRR